MHDVILSSETMVLLMFIGMIWTNKCVCYNAIGLLASTGIPRFFLVIFPYNAEIFLH